MAEGIQERRAALYPIGLKVEGRSCLVVGSGPIALRKAQDLIDCGAVVHVSESGFVPADLDGICVVVVANGDRAIQEAVSRAASERGIPCNVVDVNDLCTFYAPAILRRGDVTVSVATHGKFPLLAVAIRDRVADALGASVGPALELLDRGRALVFERYPDEPAARTAALKRLLTREAMDAIVAERLEEFRVHWETWRARL